MAEVRDFSSYARKKNNDSTPGSSGVDTSYKEKIRSHKLKVFFRTIAIAAIVLLTVIVVYVSWRDREYSEAEISLDATISNSADSKVISLGGNIVQYSKDGVSCYSSTGPTKCRILSHILVIQ